MENLFTPLGIDHIVIACENISYWSSKFERLGFQCVRASNTSTDFDDYFGLALQRNHVRIFLVDPRTKRFEKDAIFQFLKRSGSMQVVEVGVRVDSIRKANEECLRRNLPPLISECYFGDTFGDCVVAEFSFSALSSFQYKFVERREPFYPGVDHIAIAVRHLDRWVHHYKQLGFEIVYTPQKREEGLIEGKESAMRTYALRRGGWTVALVEGVNQKRVSQITTYVNLRGGHSVHHAALLFENLLQIVSTLLSLGIQFRLHKIPLPHERITAQHVLHVGEDYGGSLIQCFTKPLARKRGMGGFFFELIERLMEKPSADRQAFNDPTVIGLFESIEKEEIADDRGFIFSEP